MLPVIAADEATLFPGNPADHTRHIARGAISLKLSPKVRSGFGLRRAKNKEIERFNPNRPNAKAGSHLAEYVSNASVNIVIAHDVVFTEIFAALHLDQDEGKIPGFSNRWRKPQGI